MFDRWCASKGIGRSFEKLKQLVLVEEFKHCVPSEIQTQLDEAEANELDRAATIADDYASMHKGNRAVHQLQKNAF